MKPRWCRNGGDGASRPKWRPSAIRSDDLIAFVGDTWQNIEASWARGVETSVQARVRNNILITGSYMFLGTRITASTSPESSDTGIGEQLVRRPRNSGSLSIAVTPTPLVARGRRKLCRRASGRRFHFRSHTQSRLPKHLRQCILRHREAFHADPQGGKSPQRTLLGGSGIPGFVARRSRRSSHPLVR